MKINGQAMRMKIAARAQVRSKGQATLEMLVVLGMLFAFLALWMPVAFHVKAGFDAAAAKQYEALAEGDVAAACRSVREMGSGSQMVVEVILQKNATLEACEPSLPLRAGKSNVEVGIHDGKCKCRLLRP